MFSLSSPFIQYPLNTYYASGITLDTGNAGMKDTVPALNEYILLGEKDKKITNNHMLLCTGMHEVLWEHRRGRVTQKMKIREDFLTQVILDLRPNQ